MIHCPSKVWPIGCLALEGFEEYIWQLSKEQTHVNDQTLSVRLSCFETLEIVSRAELIFKLGWHSCDLALCSLTVYPPWTGHWWGPSVWMKTDSKICVSSDVSVWSEECAGSLFLCEGNLRSLLGKPADLWEQLTCLEKFLLLQGSGGCVSFTLHSSSSPCGSVHG